MIKGIKYGFVYHTTIGDLTIGSNGEAITHVLFGNHRDCYLEEETNLIKTAIIEITEYLEGKRRVFELPIYSSGTVFQQEVWKELCRIPYGETRSYREVAEAIGNPKACRAVGMANNKNPIGIIVPCHRVIGANGSLTGYGGGLEIKKYLLDREENFSQIWNEEM